MTFSPSRTILLLLAWVALADAFVPPATVGTKTPLEYRDSSHPDDVVAPAAAAAAVATVVSSRTISAPQQADAAVHHVKTLEEYESVVEGEKEKMVVVRFHAPWCKNCKVTAVAYNRLAKKSDLSAHIKFVDVDLDGSPASDMIKDHAAVSGVPFGLIYHSEAGLVDRLKLSRPNFSAFKKTLANYVKGSCDLPELELAP